MRIHNTPSSFIIVLLQYLCILILVIHVSGSSMNSSLDHHRHHRQTSQVPHHDNNTEERLSCVPAGECELCPEYSLHEPFCQPFGTRRLMNCLPASATSSESHPPIPGWSPCGRMISKERRDFYEFMACILFIGAAAILLVLIRSKRVRARQARVLAARIGLGGNGGREVPGGWAG